MFLIENYFNDIILNEATKESILKKETEQKYGGAVRMGKNIISKTIGTPITLAFILAISKKDYLSLTQELNGNIGITSEVNNYLSSEFDYTFDKLLSFLKDLAENTLVDIKEGSLPINKKNNLKVANYFLDKTTLFQKEIGGKNYEDIDLSEIGENVANREDKEIVNFISDVGTFMGLDFKEDKSVIIDLISRLCIGKLFIDKLNKDSAGGNIKTPLKAFECFAVPFMSEKYGNFEDTMNALFEIFIKNTLDPYVQEFSSSILGDYSSMFHGIILQIDSLQKDVKKHYDPNIETSPDTVRGSFTKESFDIVNRMKEFGNKINDIILSMQQSKLSGEAKSFEILSKAANPGFLEKVFKGTLSFIGINKDWKQKKLDKFNYRASSVSKQFEAVGKRIESMFILKISQLNKMMQEIFRIEKQRGDGEILNILKKYDNFIDDTKTKLKEPEEVEKNQTNSTQGLPIENKKTLSSEDKVKEVVKEISKRDKKINEINSFIPNALVKLDNIELVFLEKKDGIYIFKNTQNDQKYNFTLEELLKFKKIKINQPLS